MATYSLRSGDPGAERLRLLAAVHEGDTRRLLAGLDLPPAALCLDVGCGIGAVTRLIAERVAPTGGRVLGADIDPHYLDVARADAAPLGDAVQFEASAVHDLDAFA